MSVETTTVQPALNTTFGTVQALENMLDDTSLSVDQVIRIEVIRYYRYPLACLFFFVYASFNYFVAL